jgi:hypothetical protein
VLVDGKPRFSGSAAEFRALPDMARFSSPAPPPHLRLIGLGADEGPGLQRGFERLRGHRRGLLAAIRSHRADFEAAGEQAEDLRTLPGDTVELLRDMGVFWLKTWLTWAGRRWTRRRRRAGCASHP